jgi:hypothetical protein
LAEKKKKKKKKWIQGAVKRPGALTKKAEAKGMSISEYCNQKNLSTRTKRQCALAKTLKGMSKKKGKKK